MLCILTKESERRSSHMSLGEQPRTSEAQHLLADLFFLHIPKNGGTSVEEVADRRNSARMQTYDLHLSEPHPYVSLWHLVPDVYERMSRRSVDAYGPRQRWCVVRRPSDRYASCRSWSAWAHPEWGAYDLTSETRLLAEFARGRFGVHWQGGGGFGIDETVHKQPQHWFVWDARGAAQCGAPPHSKSSGQSPRTVQTWRPAPTTLRRLCPSLFKSFTHLTRRYGPRRTA